MDIGSIILFVFLAVVPPALFYMMRYGDEFKPKHVIHGGIGMSSSGVLASNNRKAEAKEAGREAFRNGKELSDCPYEDNGKDETYGYRFNLWYHWRQGFESPKSETDKRDRSMMISANGLRKMNDQLGL